jgi:hypothetical protein
MNEIAKQNSCYPGSYRMRIINSFIKDHQEIVNLPVKTYY